MPGFTLQVAEGGGHDPQCFRITSLSKRVRALPTVHLPVVRRAGFEPALSSISG